jgi:hypothetical protein
VALALLGLACSQACEPWVFGNVTVPPDGTEVTLSYSFKIANGDVYPPPCGWNLVTTGWPLYGQMIARVESAFFSPASTGWRVRGFSCNEGTACFPLAGGGTTLFTLGNGGTLQVPSVPAADLPDYTTSGIKNSSDTTLTFPTKEMRVVLDFAPDGGADQYSQYPVQLGRFKITFRVNVDQCPSDNNLWVPRKLGVTPNLLPLTRACSNYNNASCCTASAITTNQPSYNVLQRRTMDDIHIDVSGTGLQTRPFPLSTVFNHQWARNDTECYNYYQVTACSTRCSPNGIPKGWIFNNWDVLVGGSAPTRTFRVCKGFCSKVWGVCQNERIRVAAGASPSAFTEGVMIKSLYTSDVEFCQDFFFYTLPPALANSNQADTTAGNNNKALRSRVIDGTGDARNLNVQVVTDAACFDPSMEPGSGSFLAVSLLLLLLSLALSL